MNIGIVTAWFERGAAMVSRAYRDVLTPRHKVFIYARGGEQYAIGDPNWDHDYVTWAKRAWNAHLTGILWRDFARWVKANDIRVVLFNEQRFWPTIVLARRHLDIRIGAYVDYYTDITVDWHWMYDFLVCNTRRHYSVFKDHPNAIYVPWGTDLQVFKGDYNPVTPGVLTFFHSAGVSPSRKGTLLALQGFQRLEGPCRFVLHMQAPLAKHPEIERICRNDSRIEVINKTVSAPGLYHMGDVYVYPSVLEGIGLTMAEALACGLPTIATDSPPMNEFVVEGQSGWLVKPAEYRGRSDGYYWAESFCDAEGVYQAMRRAMEQRECIGQWKQRARAFAEEHLDWSRNAACLPEWFEQQGAAPRIDRDMAAEEYSAMRMAHLSPMRYAMREAARAMGVFGRESVQRVIYG